MPRSVLGRPINEQLLARIIEAAANYQVDRLPHPSKCYAPGVTIGSCVKYQRGDAAVPQPNGSRDHDEAALRRRLPGYHFHGVTDDTNSLFSAAAVSLFGCEDLYLVVRLQATHEASSHPS